MNCACPCNNVMCVYVCAHACVFRTVFAGYALPVLPSEECHNWPCAPGHWFCTKRTIALGLKRASVAATAHQPLGVDWMFSAALILNHLPRRLLANKEKQLSSLNKQAFSLHGSH